MGREGTGRAIDLDRLEELASHGGTLEDAGQEFGFETTPTDKRGQKGHASRQFLRRMRAPELRAAWERGQAKGRTSLRKRQFDAAMAGDRTMLVWLGKQMLGQTDIRRHEVSDPDGKPLAFPSWAAMAEEVHRADIAARSNGHDTSEDQPPGAPSGNGHCA